MSTDALPDDLVLWDIVEEHLDEAEFLFGQWTRALASPLFTLEVLERGLEARLLAHVDGLVVNGHPVAERVLAPALFAPEETSVSRAAAASLALLGMQQEPWVVRALLEGDPVTSQGAERALVLAGSKALDAWLVGSFEEAAAPAALLRVASGRGVALPNLLRSLQSADRGALIAAVGAARWGDSARHLPVLEYLLEAADQAIASAAMIAALTHGSLLARRRCQVLARDARQPCAAALMLVSLLGAPADQQVLLAHLTRGSHRAAALFALGYSGRAAFVPALLDQLDAGPPVIRKLAAEAIGTLTGLDLTEEAFTSKQLPEAEGALPELSDDLTSELVPTAADDLPLPNAAAIRAWWAQHGAALPAGCRVLYGEPWTHTQACEVLRRAPLRRRHPLALWLSLSSGGRTRVDAQAFTFTQRAQLERARLELPLRGDR